MIVVVYIVLVINVHSVVAEVIGVARIIFPHTGAVILHYQRLPVRIAVNGPGLVGIYQASSLMPPLGEDQMWPHLLRLRLFLQPRRLSRPSAWILKNLYARCPWLLFAVASAASSFATTDAVIS